MSLVSVVIPAFNAQDWVCDSIRSVLNQTWKDLEIIVVDDGSKDETISKAESISDSRVRVFRQENKGAAAARNRGLTQASGHFIQFLDADDWLSPDKIEKQIAALKAAPRGSVASCGWGKFVENPRTIRIDVEPVWGLEDPIKWLVCSLTGGGMMQPGCWLVPREVIEQAGPWDEELSLHDDGEYFTRVLLNSAGNVFVEGPVVGYRQVKCSLSRQRGEKAVVSALDVCRSRAQQLLMRQDSMEVRSALATQYAAFQYEFAHFENKATDLARGLQEELGCEPVNCFGGFYFRKLNELLGFRRAMALREHWFLFKTSWATHGK